MINFDIANAETDGDQWSFQTYAKLVTVAYAWLSTSHAHEYCTNWQSSLYTLILGVVQLKLKVIGLT